MPRLILPKKYFEIGDIEADTVSFFDLDQKGVEFVFNLNFIGTASKPGVCKRHDWQRGM